MKKKFLALSFFLLILLILNPILIRDKKRAEKKLKEAHLQIEDLKSDVRRLEEKLQRLKIETKTSKLRQLEFLKSPIYREVNRTQLQDKLMDEFKEEFPGQDLEKTQKVLIKFGFIPSDYNLRQNLVTLYKEQIGAFYDVDEKALFTIQGLYLGAGLENALLAHELTHTLQDQHFKIKPLIEKASKENEDQQLAIQALVEGDATLITQLYYLKSINFSFLWDILSYLLIDQKEINQAPMAIRENMLFPYLQGLEFVTSIYTRKGWEGVNRCFLQPPVSSEQILHPEKYLSGNDLPQKVTMSDLKAVTAPFQLLKENVLGEFNIELLFRNFLGDQRRDTMWEGWGGDLYQLWENPQTHSEILIWETIWDTEKDALEFFEGYTLLMAKKFPGAKLDQMNKNLKAWEAQNQWIWMGLDHNKVLVIESPEKKRIEKIRISFEGFGNAVYN